MTGVSTPVQPDHSNQSIVPYVTAIDGGFDVAKRIVWMFAPHEEETPAMTVRIDAGAIFNPITRARTDVPAQSTATISAPTTNPRNDLVYVDRETGVAEVATGTEAASPVDPEVPAGKVPIARVRLTVGMSQITNADIDDERSLFALGLPFGTGANNIVTLDGDGKLPAVDGSNLTGVLPPTVSQAEAEAGTGTDTRLWTPERVAQAIAALSMQLPETVSQAEAEAGTSMTDRLWTAQRVAQAIAAQSGTDQVSRDMATTAMAVADSNGAAGGKGPFYLADPFTADTLAVKTNATYDAANNSYNNFDPICDGTIYSDDCTSTSGWGTAGVSGGGTFSQGTFGGRSAFKNYCPSSGGNSEIDRDVGDIPNGKASAQTAFQLNSLNLTPTTTNWAFRLYLSSTARIVILIRNNTAILVQDGNGDSYDTGFSVTTGTWYDVVANADGPNGTATVWVDGIEVYSGSIQNDLTGQTEGYLIPGVSDYGHVGAECWTDIIKVGSYIEPSNMTLEPNAATLDTADPDHLMAYFRIESVDAVAMGTDIIGKLSIDGGTTLATGTWTKVGPFGSDEELWRLDADVSGQTGASAIWQLTTANNKEVNIHGCVGVVPIY